jgi:hypothetical protein
VTECDLDEDDKRPLELAAGGTSTATIAWSLERSAPAIRRPPSNLEIALAASHSDRTKEEEERLRQLVLANMPPFDIAVSLGRTVSAINAKSHALGLTIARAGIEDVGYRKWG